MIATAAAELRTRTANKVRRLLVHHAGRRSFPLRADVPYVSFTFDDFPRSAWVEGGRILSAAQLHGTFFISMNLAGADSPSGPVVSHDDLRTLLGEGHELGCHTFDHLDGCASTVEAFERSIGANRRALEALVPGGRFRTFAYPLDGPVLDIKRAVGRHFACCRGGGQTHNAGDIDLNLLKGYFLDWRNQNDLAAVREIIDRNAAARGWLILATHDVAPAPSRYGCSPGFFADVVDAVVRSGARVVPMTRACDELGITAYAR
ncbi:MAG TPA: polysaccharide deacetylase family protein [Vicinamibacterales bacterium]|nr:polysaccharide deacetylase family protein [Vicinamibacterales bacterium]